MASKKISAVDIEKLWYAEIEELSTAVANIETPEGFTPAMLKTLIGKSTEIVNVHQNTWQIEEAEASQDSYKNQLTGKTYRMGTKTMGDLTAAFTIGQYDYATKAALLGGTVVLKGGDGADKNDAIGWARSRDITDIHKVLIARTEDKQYVVFTEANFKVRESNADGAIGLAVNATSLEPSYNDVLSSEYWYDGDEVDA